MKKVNQIVATILLLLVLSCSKNTYDLFVVFPNVDGLEIKDEVTVNGLQIGSVKDMKLIKNGVLVNLSINDDTQLGNSSKFKIVQAGLLEGKRIEVEGSENGSLFLTDKDTIK